MIKKNIFMFCAKGLLLQYEKKRRCAVGLGQLNPTTAEGPRGDGSSPSLSR